MQDDHGHDAARRRTLGLGAGAAALVGLAQPAQAARAASAPLRVRYRLEADFTLSMLQSNIIPFSRTTFDDGLDCTLEADGRVLVNTAGLYRISLRTDWVAQAGLDIDLRKVNIRHQPPSKDGRPPPPRESDERLAAADTPASSVPRTARAQLAWQPGPIAPGAAASVQLALASPTAFEPGDLALASHDAICDAVVGPAATDALVVHARVVAGSQVRVSIVNQSPRDAITVPAGQLNVLAMTAVVTAGESTDAYQTLHTATEALKAGERIYASCYSHTPGDYLQATRATWLQIERMA